MALEIRVYDEVTDVDPKVMWGMTFRQLIAVATSVVLIAGATTWLVVTGRSEQVANVSALIGLPLAAWAWFKPMGLHLEVWLPHALKVLAAPRRLLYVNEPVWGEDQEKLFANAIAGRKNVSWKEAKRRPEAGQ
jgi:hypothetical protein